MKKIELKLYGADTFEAFLKVQLYKIYRDESIVHEKVRYVEFMLENENNQLTAKTFFVIITALELDLKIICTQFFENVAATRLKSSKKELDQLFGLFFNTKRDLSEATGI